MLDTDNYQIFLIFATETDCENFCHRNRKPKPKPIQNIFATETENRNRNRKSATETETDSKKFCHRNRKALDTDKICCDFSYNQNSKLVISNGGGSEGRGL